MHYDFKTLLKAVALGAVLITFACIGTLHAQSLTKEVTYGDADEDFGFHAATTADGGVVQIGQSGSGANNKLYVVRSDAEGNRVWERIYDITYIENLGAIREAVNGDLIWTATVEISPGSEWDIMVCRTDADGNILWMKLIGENNNAYDFGASLIEAANGDIIVCGTTDLYGQSKTVVVRLQSDLTFIWSYFYGSSLQEESAADLLELPNGDIVVAGSTWLGLSTQGLIYSINFNGLTVKWSRIYGNAEAQQGFASITTNSSGDLYACGSWFNSYQDSRIFVVSADASSGVATDLKTYQYNSDHRIDARSISRSVTTDNLVLTGSIENVNGSGSQPAYFLEIDRSLRLQRFKLYGSHGNSVGNAIEYTPGDPGVTDPGYWISGHSSAFSSSFDYYLVRSNLTGFTDCSVVANLSDKKEGVDLNFPLIFDSFSGTSDISPTNDVVTTDRLVCREKYVNPWFGKQGLVKDDPPAGEASSVINQLRLYPNPAAADNEVRLQISATQNTTVLLTVRDVHGKTVLQKQQALASGVTSFRLDVRGLSAGVYYLHVSASEFSRAMQMTLLR